MTVVGELPSGPDPEQLRVSPDGTLVFVANENDALTLIDKAKEMLQNPPAWTNPTDSKGDPIQEFACSFPSTTSSGGRNAQKTSRGVTLKDTLTGQDIPNKWFLDNGLPLLDPKVPLQDPDKDGFPNEDEWRAGTDPNNKESHPPYVSKLFLKRFEKVQFRLIFKGYDGDPKKDPSGKTFDYQIDTLDLKQPDSFKLGDIVSKTKFKLEKFEFKTKYNDKIQETEALFGPDDRLAAALLEAGTASGERLWRIPLARTTGPGWTHPWRTWPTWPVGGGPGRSTRRCSCASSPAGGPGPIWTSPERRGPPPTTARTPRARPGSVRTCCSAGWRPAPVAAPPSCNSLVTAVSPV